MSKFTYLAKNKSGEFIEGETTGNAKQDVLMWIQGNGLTVISVEEISETKVKSKRKAVKKAVTSNDLSEFCWQLATMLEGGVALIDGINTIADDIDNKYFKECLNALSEKMQQGDPFSESLELFPGIFDNLFCAMIHAGESGGSLVNALERLGEHCANKDTLGRKIKGAMAYPVFVLLFVTVILAAVVTFILPRFQDIFDTLGGELPSFTVAFLFVCDILKHNAPIFLGLMIGIWIMLKVYDKTEKGHFVISKIKLKLPLVGVILTNAFVVVFCRTLSTLLQNGVPIIESLAILSKMTNNEVIRRAIASIQKDITEGGNIAESMRKTKFFPNMCVKMVQVGEESGALPKVLDRTSQYFQRKVESLITAMTALLEPAMIVIVGAIVMVVVLALYLPIFSMGGSGNSG